MQTCDDYQKEVFYVGRITSGAAETVAVSFDGQELDRQALRTAVRNARTRERFTRLAERLGRG